MEHSFWINPFIKIAGLKSLIYGMIGLFLVAVAAYITGTHFYGLSNLDFAKNSGFSQYAYEHILGWLVISIFLYLSGLVLSKTKIRLIDVFGTSLLARLPLLIVPLLRFFPFFQSFVFESAEMYVLIGIYFLSLIWTIILLFNGFKTSSNLKGLPLTIAFALSLVVSEIIVRSTLNLIPSL